MLILRKVLINWVTQMLPLGIYIIGGPRKIFDNKCLFLFLLGGDQISAAVGGPTLASFLIDPGPDLIILSSPLLIALAIPTATA